MFKEKQCYESLTKLRFFLKTLLLQTSLNILFVYANILQNGNWGKIYVWKVYQEMYIKLNLDSRKLNALGSNKRFCNREPIRGIKISQLDEIPPLYHDGLRSLN